MAFPFLDDETFDAGTLGGFDSETDASSILDYPDYKELARQGFAPFQGAHALRVRLSGTAVAYVQENDDYDTTADGTIHVWFPVCIGADVTLSDTDTVILFALQSAGPVNEVVVGLRNNGGVYELFAGETGATRTLAITRSNTRWYQVELSANIDAGGGNDGTVDFYVDGAPVGAQITGLNQEVISQAQFGVVSGTAAGNTGTILLGRIIADDARIYPRERFPVSTVWVTRDINAFVGPCEIETVQLTGTSTNATVTIYDTDVYSSTGVDFSREPVVYTRNITANDQSPSQNTPIQVKKGAYVELSGTNPQAWLTLCKGAPVLSHANYVNRGLKR